ncbi:MAG: GEVED domain-containing protein, partial [Xanthomonadales bacterium]|nr:GEVED domain-containing protein [Xanthomonadales bacterium]
DEFYGGDEFHAPGEEHRETHLGGLAHLFGSNEMLMTAIDPERLDSGGIYWMSNSNGSKVRDLELYRGAAGNGFFGKSAGLGDSELMCDVAPLELGNRLWCDTDNNGVQDPDELNSGFPSVSVTLECGASPVTVNTNAFGEYLFTDAIYAAANGGALIPRNSNVCSISVNTAGANGTALDNFCGGRVATTPNNGGVDAGADLRDSDAMQLAPDLISIAIADTGASGMNNHALDIGISGTQDLDFGDAPDPAFPTLAANNGASHVLGGPIFLGSCVDAETDGAPSSGADGDDLAVGAPVFGTCAGNDDEDGVSFTSLLVAGSNASLDVTASSACLLDAWIDFNNNGSWADAGEQIFASQALAVGVNSLNYSVPGTAAVGTSYARFRCSTAGGLSFNGAAADGEVEDYRIQINASFALGDFVWFDSNQNGIQDAGELGVNGVNAALYGNSNCSGAPMASTTTANGGPGGVDGYYEFLNLPAANYCVAFSNLPAGYQVSPQNQGADDALDSDADPATLQIQNINLTANDFTNDMGVFLDGSIAGLTWCESSTNANTSYDAGDGDSLLSAISVTLYSDANCSNTVDGSEAATAVVMSTNGSGAYLFDNLPVGPVGNELCYITEVDTNDPDLGSCDTSITSTSLGPDLDTANPNSTDNNFGFDDQLSLGDFVWFDTNQDGIQDAGELGVNGVSVALYDNATCTGSAVGNTTTANGGSGAVDGYYDFQNLDAGIYCVAFSNLPAGYQVSPQNQGADDALDSDADPATRQIQNINLLDDDFTNDMGVFVIGSVAGLTWCESNTNANTSYDAGDGDMLLSDIQVTLYQDANCSNTVDGNDATTATSMDTDGAGAYLFANLAVGPVGNPVCYITEVDSADVDLGNCDSAITPTSLGPDLDTANPDSTDNNFGFDDQLGLGDYVWYDNNQNGRQDIEEPGVNNITVNLYDNASCTGSSIASMVTRTGGPSNSAGHYFFP